MANSKEQKPLSQTEVLLIACHQEIANVERRFGNDFLADRKRKQTCKDQLQELVTKQLNEDSMSLFDFHKALRSLRKRWMQGQVSFFTGAAKHFVTVIESTRPGQKITALDIKATFKRLAVQPITEYLATCGGQVDLDVAGEMYSKAKGILRQAICEQRRRQAERHAKRKAGTKEVLAESLAKLSNINLSLDKQGGSSTSA